MGTFDRAVVPNTQQEEQYRIKTYYSVIFSLLTLDTGLDDFVDLAIFTDLEDDMLVCLEDLVFNVHLGFCRYSSCGMNTMMLLLLLW